MPALSKPIDAAPRRLLVIVRCIRPRGGGAGASTALGEVPSSLSSETLAALEKLPEPVQQELLVLTPRIVRMAASTPAVAEDAGTAASVPAVAEDAAITTTEVAPAANRLSNARYTEPAIVFELASTGDVRLLSFNWLAERVEIGQLSGKPFALPRRQELPDAAFADMVALRAAHAALPPHVAKAVVPVVSISYCWLSAPEPDATGEQLRHIVDVLQEHAEANEDWSSPGDVAGWRNFFSDMAVFWDWGSIYQKDPRLFDPKETPEAQPEAEREAFIADLKAGRRAYGGAAYDASRSEAEYAAFKRGLHDTMDVWCAAQPCISASPRSSALTFALSHVSGTLTR